MALKFGGGWCILFKMLFEVPVVGIGVCRLTSDLN